MKSAITLAAIAVLLTSSAHERDYQFDAGSPSPAVPQGFAQEETIRAIGTENP